MEAKNVDIKDNDIHEPPGTSDGRPGYPFSEFWNVPFILTALQPKPNPRFKSSGQLV
jgi:hypothetical protein